MSELSLTRPTVSEENGSFTWTLTMPATCVDNFVYTTDLSADTYNLVSIVEEVSVSSTEVQVTFTMADSVDVSSVPSHPAFEVKLTVTDKLYGFLVLE